jgi:hypothetical protein
VLFVKKAMELEGSFQSTTLEDESPESGQGLATLGLDVDTAKFRRQYAGVKVLYKMRSK